MPKQATLDKPRVLVRHFSVDAVAEALDTTSDRILDWIAAGEIKARNIAKKSNGHRPNWRIPETEIERFLEARENRPPSAVDSSRPIPPVTQDVPHHFRKKHATSQPRKAGDA
jgi:hypothetical protein